MSAAGRAESWEWPWGERERAAVSLCAAEGMGSPARGDGFSWASPGCLFPFLSQALPALPVSFIPRGARGLRVPRALLFFRLDIRRTSPWEGFQALEVPREV